MVAAGRACDQYVGLSYVEVSYMARPLKTLRSNPPSAAALRQLAKADPTIPPAVMPRTGGEVINLRLSSSLVDELDAAAEAGRTTRKVIITRALAKAGFHVPAHDLEDRTPRKRRRVTPAERSSAPRQAAAATLR
jgi:hypothetical protein